MGRPRVVKEKFAKMMDLPFAKMVKKRICRSTYPHLCRINPVSNQKTHSAPNGIPPPAIRLNRGSPARTTHPLADRKDCLHSRIADHMLRKTPRQCRPSRSRLRTSGRAPASRRAYSLPVAACQAPQPRGEAPAPRHAPSDRRSSPAHFAHTQ